MFNEQDIQKFMTNLSLSRAEAIQLLEDDLVDKETPEMEAMALAAKEVTKGMAKAVDAYGKTRTREIKINQDKLDIMSLITNELVKVTDSMPEMTNPEREMTFLYKNVEYKLILSVPRAKKAT